MPSDEQRALRVPWLLLALIAVGAIVIAVTSIADGGTDSSDTVETQASAEGKGNALTEAEIADLVEKEAAKNSAPAAPADSGGTGSFKVTKFACKTDIGVDDRSCGTVYEAGGLRVRADCSASGLTAIPEVDHAAMTVESIDEEGSNFGSIPDSTAGRGFTLTSATGPASTGTVTFVPPNSATVILVDFSATYSPGATQGDCVFVGRVMEL